MRLTEADVRRLARETSFAQGEDYFHRGAVLEVIRRGNALYARVQGSEEERLPIEPGLAALSREELLAL